MIKCWECATPTICAAVDYDCGHDDSLKHHPDCDDKMFDSEFCGCNEPSGRDDPESISNLMIEGPPK